MNLDSNIMPLSHIYFMAYTGNFNIQQILNKFGKV